MAYIEFLRYTAVQAVMASNDEELLDFISKLLIHEEVKQYDRI